MSFYKRAQKIIYTIPVFAGYILLSLVFGERQPFTCIPMYNNLPNWAYAFYVKNEKGETLYFLRDFHNLRNSSNTGHIFYMYFEDRHLSYGNEVETKAQIHEVGEHILDFLGSSFQPQVSCDSIFLVRKSIFFEGPEMKEKDEIIAARKI